MEMIVNAYEYVCFLKNAFYTRVNWLKLSGSYMHKRIMPSSIQVMTWWIGKHWASTGSKIALIVDWAFRNKLHC